MIDATGIHGAIGGLRAHRIAPSPSPSDPDLEEYPAPSTSRPGNHRDSPRTGLKSESAPQSALPVASASPREIRQEGNRPFPNIVPERPLIVSAVSTRPAIPAAVLERILEAAPHVRPQKTTWLLLTLSPAHLGDLRIELTLKNARLHGRVLTQSNSAKDQILAHLDQIRLSLESREIQVGDIQ